MPRKSDSRDCIARLPHVVLLLVVGLLFGIVFALVKGTAGGWHIIFGNLSAPWLVLPIFTGALVSRRVFFAGLAGAACALLSLLGFYGTTATLWHLVNSHTTVNNLTFLVAGTLGAGIVAGGSAVLKRRGKIFLIGALLAMEPFGWGVWYVVTHEPFPGLPVLVFVAEMFLGVGVVIAGVSWSGARQRTSPGSSEST